MKNTRHFYNHEIAVFGLILAFCAAAAPITRIVIERADGTSEAFAAQQPPPVTQPSTSPVVVVPPTTQPAIKFPLKVAAGMDITIENKVIEQGSDDCAVLMTGGKLTMRNCIITNGGLANIQGGESAEFYDCSSVGQPSQARSKPGSYLLITSTNRLGKLTWINTKGQILKEGGSESCIRVMDCKTTYLKGLIIQSANSKPDIVIRSDDLEGHGGDGTATVEDCEVRTMEVGAQKVNADYIDQRLGLVTIRNSRIRGGTKQYPVIRSPGVRKLVYENVTVSDGVVTR